MKTPVAAMHLNTTYHRLIDLVRFQKIPAQGKDTSGHYIWGQADLDRAREALKMDRRKRQGEAG
jgi:hypothetical protein